MSRNIIGGAILCTILMAACHKDNKTSAPSSTTTTSTEDLTASARMDSSVNVMIMANDSLMRHHHDAFSHHFDAMFHHADSTCWKNHAEYEHYDGHMDTETENDDYYKYMMGSGMQQGMGMGMHHGAASNSTMHHMQLHDRLDSIYKAHMPLH